METRSKTKQESILDDPVREAQPLARVEPQQDEQDILEFLKRRNRLVEEVLRYAVGATHPSHWTALGDRPWLSASGSEVVALRCGVKMRQVRSVREEREDEHGAYYEYTNEAVFYLPDGSGEWPAIGTCSSRDQFLGTEIQGAQFEEGNIAKAARSNCIVNGVCGLLGLRGMTWERLATLNPDITPEKCAAVKYKHGARGGGTSSHDAFTFRFGPGKDKAPADVADADLAWYAQCFERDIADPEKAKFRANNQKQLALVRTEQAARKQPATAAPKEAAPIAPTPWALILSAALDRSIDRGTLMSMLGRATGKASTAALTLEDVAKVARAMDQFLAEGDDIPE